VPFRPCNEAHAIQEVIFVLLFSRNFKKQEVSALEAAHDLWRDDLPRFRKPHMFAVHFGNEPPTQEPIAGCMFDKYKPDGSLAWRLQANEDSLVVNCLDYTRWNDVWGSAKRFLDSATKALEAEGLFIRSVGLQYIDLFLWDGDANDYDSSELLKADSDFIPASIRNKGPFWHLHQGWFQECDEPLTGRLLERMHLDSADDTAKGELFVRCDNTLRIDLFTPIDPNEFFDQQDGFSDSVYDFLHEKNKHVMRNYLNEETVKNIRLDSK